MTLLDPKTYGEYPATSLAWFPPVNLPYAPRCEKDGAPPPAPRHGKIFPVTWPGRERASA